MRAEDFLRLKLPKARPQVRPRNVRLGPATVVIDKIYSPTGYKKKKTAEGKQVLVPTSQEFPVFYREHRDYSKYPKGFTHPRKRRARAALALIEGEK